MKFFKKKQDEYIDLDKHLSKQERKVQNIKSYKASEDGTVDLTGQLLENTSAPKIESQASNSKSSQGGFFGSFFGATQPKDIPESTPEPEPSETRKKKISEVIRKLSSRIEEQDNEIYKLKQRLEVLERKSRIDY
jgi:predicted RNase H-like nuclease (RuvC/YqgF family)